MTRGKTNWGESKGRGRGRGKGKGESKCKSKSRSFTPLKSASVQHDTSMGFGLRVVAGVGS